MGKNKMPSGLITPSNEIIGADKSRRKPGQATKDQMDKYAELQELMEEAKDPKYNMVLKDPDEEKLQASLHEFVFGDDYPEALEYVELLDDSSIICKLFRHEEEFKTDILLPGREDKKNVRTMILPYVKVLKAHEKSDLKQGDILAAPDDVTVIEMNLHWVGWNKAQEVERPKPEDPEPTKFTGRVIDWRQQAMYVVDKENPSEEDLWTFFLPEHMFKTKIRKEKFEQ